MSKDREKNGRKIELTPLERVLIKSEYPPENDKSKFCLFLENIIRPIIQPIFYIGVGIVLTYSYLEYPTLANAKTKNIKEEKIIYKKPSIKKKEKKLPLTYTDSNGKKLLVKYNIEKIYISFPDSKYEISNKEMCDFIKKNSKFLTQNSRLEEIINCNN